VSCRGYGCCDGDTDGRARACLDGCDRNGGSWIDAVAGGCKALGVVWVLGDAGESCGTDRTA